MPAGSSPLTRGKPFDRIYTEGRTRLIPAHAGKTLPAALRLQKTWAHPRSRGENRMGGASRWLARGSSPLTRGKPTYNLPNYVGERLIPAHAGKTRRPCGTTRGRRAHPRSRGENLTSSPSSCRHRGSSPLTRGKHGVYAGGSPGIGLIPAHAGKTPTPCGVGVRRGAHPRSRGENTPETEGSATLAGSSPLTRGKRWWSCEGLLAPGLIPAHAGKTRRPCGRSRGSRAHPRSRGENPMWT